MAVQELALQSRSRFARLTRFLREVRAELRKVTWPTKQELIANTIVVLVSVFFAAALIWVIDSFLTQLLKIFIAK